MLFHVTMTHTADNCPAYHVEKMPALLAALDKLEEVGRETNVKAHALLWGAPDHVAFAVLEADSLGAIGRYLNSIPITQEFKITPVQNVSDVVEFGKAAMARAATQPG
jgi:muconolactone delta-isomerase